MSANRRKSPALRRKGKEEVNKRALIWIGVIFAVIVVGMALLLILTR